MLLVLIMICRFAVAPLARVAPALIFQIFSGGHRPFLCGPLWPLELLERVNRADQGIFARAHRRPPWWTWRSGPVPRAGPPELVAPERVGIDAPDVGHPAHGDTSRKRSPDGRPVATAHCTTSPVHRSRLAQNGHMGQVGPW
jgi:hypothetical protein